MVFQSKDKTTAITAVVIYVIDNISSKPLTKYQLPSESQYVLIKFHFEKIK